jgi:hypothetical protein
MEYNHEFVKNRVLKMDIDNETILLAASIVYGKEFEKSSKKSGRIGGCFPRSRSLIIIQFSIQSIG